MARPTSLRCGERVQVRERRRLERRLPAELVDRLVGATVRDQNHVFHEAQQYATEIGRPARYGHGMPRRLVTSIVVVLATGLVVAGCSDRDDSNGNRRTIDHDPRHDRAPAAATTTTTTAADLAAVNIKLTQLADGLERPDGDGHPRPGDETLYVTEKVGPDPRDPQRAARPTSRCSTSPRW